MPTSTNRQNKNPQLLRLIIASLIGVCIGYYLFGLFKKEQIKVVKGTICLVIDDFGFAQTKDVQNFFQINENITASSIFF